MADKVYELVFHFHTAMSDTLLQLKDLEPHFDARKQSLREGAMKIRRLSADILSDLLFDIHVLEEKEQEEFFEEALKDREEQLHGEEAENIHSSSQGEENPARGTIKNGDPKIPHSEPKTIVVDIPEARNKRIRELGILELDPDWGEFCVSIDFDDETQIVLDLSAPLRFGVEYLQWIDGNSKLLKKYPPRLLRP